MDEETNDPIIGDLEDQSAEKTLLEWEAFEYMDKEKTMLWYVIFGIVFIFILAYCLITRDFFGAGFCVILAICLVVYKTQQPSKFHYRITQFGLYINNKPYSFDTIHSFTLNTSREPKMVSFIFTKAYMPELSIVLGKTDPLTIKQVLGDYIPEDPDRVDTLTTKIIRFLKLQ